MNTRRCDFFLRLFSHCRFGTLFGNSLRIILYMGRFGEKRINRCIYTYSPLHGNFDDDVLFQNWHMDMSKIMVHYVVSVSICKLLAYPDTQCTPPKTNMEPENAPLEKENHLQTTNCWVPC